MQSSADIISIEEGFCLDVVRMGLQPVFACIVLAEEEGRALDFTHDGSEPRVVPHVRSSKAELSYI